MVMAAEVLDGISPEDPKNLPEYDKTKPWWQNIGCPMRFWLNASHGYTLHGGVLIRIDVLEYRKYVVVGIAGENYESINIDHILSVQEI
jgi:hypothetical protein